ncbi:hypothetical protein ACFOHS_06595 [Jhaorihella thermophila]
MSGTIVAAIQKRLTIRRLIAAGLDRAAALARFNRDDEKVRPNWWYFIGGAAFLGLSLLVGLGDVPGSQEIVFAGSMGGRAVPYAATDPRPAAGKRPARWWARRSSSSCSAPFPCPAQAPPGSKSTCWASTSSSFRCSSF